MARIDQNGILVGYVLRLPASWPGSVVPQGSESNLGWAHKVSESVSATKEEEHFLEPKGKYGWRLCCSCLQGKVWKWKRRLEREDKEVKKG